MEISLIELTERFERDYKRLPPELQRLAKEIIKNQLKPWPSKKALRHHTLSGYKPTIHKIDITPNHSHQITFWLDGSVARLLRIGSHKEIDRQPN